jgi:predicted lipase
MPSAIFSVTEAVRLGEFVLAAYDLYTAGDPAAFAPPKGYKLVSKIYADDLTVELTDYRVFGYIAQLGTDVVVAIRGTENILEWIRDFEFALTAFPYATAGRTEAGFTDFYSSLRTSPNTSAKRVVDALRDLVAGGGVKTLTIAGHSLGSALATLLALDVAANGVFAAPVVYTFASPAVGDKVFAGSYDRLIETSWRIANLNDLVPCLPPRLAGYIHVDAELPINSDDQSKHSVSCWHQLRTYLHVFDARIALDSGCKP